MTLAQNVILRYGHFCGFLDAKVVNLDPIDFQLGLPFNINRNDGLNKFQLSKNVAKMAHFWPKIGQDATFTQNLKGNLTRPFLSDFDVRPHQND